MIPFIFAALGGYFIADSLSDGKSSKELQKKVDKIKFEDGGDINPTNEEVLRNGDYIDSWLSEDGKTQEIIMEYMGSQYLISSDAYGMKPKRPMQKATHWYNEMEYKKGGKIK